MDLYDDKNFKPMLLGEVAKPFDDPNYLFELKFDGIRALIYASPQEVLIKNRRGNTLNQAYPELLKIKKLVKKKVIFDGEIIIMDKGKPSFAKLQQRSHLQSAEKIAYYVKELPVIFIAYDLLYEAEDLTTLTLLERKTRLNKYGDNQYFVKAKFFPHKGKALFRAVQKQDLEGIVAKKASSHYYISQRSSEWLKIKNWHQEVFYICGYLDETKTASLLLGEKEQAGYRYVGKVTIHFNNPEYMIIKKSPLAKSPVIFKEGFKYLKPILICQVEYLERTKRGSLRQPVYRGLKKRKN